VRDLNAAMVRDLDECEGLAADVEGSPH